MRILFTAAGTVFWEFIKLEKLIYCDLHAITWGDKTNASDGMDCIDGWSEWLGDKVSQSVQSGLGRKEAKRASNAEQRRRRTN